MQLIAAYLSSIIRATLTATQYRHNALNDADTSKTLYLYPIKMFLNKQHQMSYPKVMLMEDVIQGTQIAQHKRSGLVILRNHIKRYVRKFLNNICIEQTTH